LTGAGVHLALELPDEFAESLLIAFRRLSNCVWVLRRLASVVSQPSTNSGEPFDKGRVLHGLRVFTNEVGIQYSILPAGNSKGWLSGLTVPVNRPERDLVARYGMLDLFYSFFRGLFFSSSSSSCSSTPSDPISSLDHKHPFTRPSILTSFSKPKSVLLTRFTMLAARRTQF
jgi:hypothetical protein